MPQIFRPRSNAIVQCVILAAVGGVILLAVAVELYKGSAYVTEVGVPIQQVVPFSHEHHAGGLGIDCRYCHTSVEVSSFAGIPPTKTCMTCHSQIWTQAEILEPVRKSYETGSPIHWQRIYRLPDFVYFNHSIHVQKGVGCATCHGRVDKMPLTWAARSFFMQDCLECHSEPERFLRPRDQVFNMEWIPPADPQARAQLASELRSQYHIEGKAQGRNRLLDCNVCHR